MTQSGWLPDPTGRVSVPRIVVQDQSILELDSGSVLVVEANLPVAQYF